MPDDLTVVESKPLPNLSVVSSQPLRESGPGLGERLTRSYNPNVEDWAQKHPHVGPIVRFLDAAGGAAMSTPEAIVKGIRDAAKFANNPYDPSNETVQSVGEGVTGWANPNVRKAALSLLPEALGQGVGSVAGGEIMGPVAEAAGKGAGKGLNLTGKALSPIKPQLSSIADVAMHPTQIPGKIIKAVVDQIPDTPELAAAKQRILEEQQGTEINKARAMQDAEIRRQARIKAQQEKAATEPKATPAESIPKGTNYGQFLEQRRLETEAAMKSPIVKPGTPVPESEGRPATWKNQSVADLATTGGPLTRPAAVQAQLRQLDIPNLNLIADPNATMTPSMGRVKSVTRFDSGGSPIREIAPNAPLNLSPAEEYMRSLNLGPQPEVELANRGGVKPNASGESSASLEAQSRIAGEKAKGLQRVKIDTRSGKEIPLLGVDAVDAKPGPYDQIVMRDASGNEITLDQGERAISRRPKK